MLDVCVCGGQNCPMQESEFFWSQVNKEGPTPAHCPELGPCWEWTAGRRRRGYGYLRIGDRQVICSRWAYEEANGEIPEGFLVLHKCDNPPCVRASHLFLGTQSDNMRDMVAKGRHREPMILPPPKQAVPPMLRRLSAAAGVPPKVFLQQALDASTSYEDCAFEFGIHSKTLWNWRVQMGGLERGTETQTF